MHVVWPGPRVLRLKLFKLQHVPRARVVLYGLVLLISNYLWYKGHLA